MAKAGASIRQLATQRKKAALLRFGGSFGLVATPVVISLFVPRASWLARTDLGQMFDNCIFVLP